MRFINLEPLERISAEVMENSPEYWEIKDFPNFIPTLVKLPSGIQERPQLHNFKSLLQRGKLIEVKRITDDVVFGIGDAIKRSEDLDGIITEFVFDEEWVGGLKIQCDNGFATNINDARHIDKPQFRFETEDGEPIYDDMPYHIVQVKYATYGGEVCYPSHSRVSDKFLRFASEANAMDYIVKNRKCLSIADLEKIADSGEDPDAIFGAIEEVVKQRI